MGIFNKLNLSENLKILKKTDKDVCCANCGIRTGLITRERLIDEKCLCVRCQNALPSFYKSRYDTMSFEEYSKMYAYMTGESKELEKIFKKKHSFSALQLDTTNGILRYKPFHSVPLYIKLDNISYFSLECINAIDGLGDIRLTLQGINPYFYIVETAVQKEFESDCLKFMEYYYAIKNYRESNNYSRINDNETEYEYTGSENNTSSESTKLQGALALFMFDTLSEVTAESLKAQRNRLIKSFHPDTSSEEDTKYAQKINEAYELLRDYVK